MALLITDDRLNCGACEPECPHGAIYEGGASWRWSDATRLHGPIQLLDSQPAEAEADQPPLSLDYYYIVPGKCNECVGYHEEPPCAAVCPVDVFVHDEAHREMQPELIRRAQWLHQTADPFSAYAEELRKRPPLPPPACGCGGRG